MTTRPGGRMALAIVVAGSLVLGLASIPAARASADVSFGFGAIFGHVFGRHSSLGVFFSSGPGYYPRYYRRRYVPMYYDPWWPGTVVVVRDRPSYYRGRDDSDSYYLYRRPSSRRYDDRAYDDRAYDDRRSDDRRSDDRSYDGRRPDDRAYDDRRPDDRRPDDRRADDRRLDDRALSGTAVDVVVADIETAFRNGDITLLERYVPEDDSMLVEVPSRAPRSITGKEYLDMTNDAFMEMRTVRYSLGRPEPGKNGTWVVAGTHVVKAELDKEKTYDVAFILAKRSGRWVITEVRANPAK